MREASLRPSSRRLCNGRRPGQTGDVVAFLTSDDAAFITGQVIMADGGLARL